MLKKWGKNVLKKLKNVKRNILKMKEMKIYKISRSKFMYDLKKVIEKYKQIFTPSKITSMYTPCFHLSIIK